MKKQLTLVAVAMMALAAVSCQKEEKTLTFTASIEHSHGKLAINDDNYLVWQGGEEVVIYDGGSNRAIYTATPQTNPTFATLTATSGTLSDEGSYRAYYPASETYTTVNHEIGKMSMVAESSTSTLQFKNLCGVLRVNIPQTASENIASIQVTASQAIAGAFDFSWDGTTPSIAAATGNTNTVDTITYSTPVDISTTGDHFFYIFLPPATYSDLYLTFTDNTGKWCTMSAENVTVVRSAIHPVSVGTISFLPQGTKGGLFTVSEGKQVRFSQGNLQYKASTGIWRFAEQQYDVIGSANASISSTYAGWIDLFGWGTSGWNSGATCYQPYSQSRTNTDYYPGGNSSNNLTGDYANADWGVYNAISNGGNQAGLWRTLTKDEWAYLINGRSASTRFCKAQVNDVNGVILFPDSYTHPTGVTPLASINTTTIDFTSNSYSLSDWASMEAAGAVFLPVAGRRSGTTVSNVDTEGDYWSASASASSANNAHLLKFDSSRCLPRTDISRYVGCSVRLVQE